MPINGFLYVQLKLVAEQQGFDCPETVAELFIRERLERMPEIEDLAKRRAAKRKEADDEWRAAPAPLGCRAFPDRLP